MNISAPFVARAMTTTLRAGLYVFAATNASAQLIGTQHPLPASPGCTEAYAIVPEIGSPVHIKSHSWNECAVYSPDGFTI